jgi:hypothetical protein
MSDNAELNGSIDDLRELVSRDHGEVGSALGRRDRRGTGACDRAGRRGVDGMKCGRIRSRSSRRMSRSMGLKTLAKEYIWLWDVRHGVSIKEIAMRERVSLHRVRFGVARSRALERGCSNESAIQPPRLIPLFPLGPLTPQSACGHLRPIETGSILCCVVCHCSGIDDHPALKRDPLTDPAPEPKPAPEPMKPKRETRRQRRQRIFGISSLMSAS